MAILNFQKPDKVIMIDSSEFEGKFEFRPLVCNRPGGQEKTAFF